MSRYAFVLPGRGSYTEASPGTLTRAAAEPEGRAFLDESAGYLVDVYLPAGQSALVSIGQRMVAGETVLADLEADEPEREARRS